MTTILKDHLGLHAVIEIPSTPGAAEAEMIMDPKTTSNWAPKAAISRAVRRRAQGIGLLKSSLCGPQIVTAGTSYIIPVRKHGGFLKWGSPQIVHLSRIFPCKPSILGYPHLWKPPHLLCESASSWHLLCDWTWVYPCWLLHKDCAVVRQWASWHIRSAQKPRKPVLTAFNTSNACFQLLNQAGECQ